MMRAFVILGFCCLALGSGTAGAHDDPPLLLTRCDQLILIHPDDPDLRLQRGELLRADERWSEAETEYGAALERGADPGRVAVCLATLELDRGDPAAALDVLRPVVVGDCAVWILRGRALRLLDRPHEAAAALERALAAAPRPRPEDYLELADVILEQGDHAAARALAVLDRGLQRLGQAAALVQAAVDLEARRGAFAAALARLDAAPPAIGDTPAALARRGAILRQAGREMEAQAAFTTALDRLEALPPARRAAPALAELGRQLRACLRTPLPPEVSP